MANMIKKVLLWLLPIVISIILIKRFLLDKDFTNPKEEYKKIKDTLAKTSDKKEESAKKYDEVKEEISELNEEYKNDSANKKPDESVDDIVDRINKR